MNWFKIVAYTMWLICMADSVYDFMVGILLMHAHKPGYVLVYALSTVMFLYALYWWSRVRNMLDV